MFSSKIPLRRHCAAAFSAAFFILLPSAPALAQATFSGSVRPFVTGVIPVVGPNGFVGGVAIDAQGALSRAGRDDLTPLREARKAALAPIASSMNAPSPMRKISLRSLDEEIATCLQAQKPLSDAVRFLAGLQRIEYVFVYPQRADIVLAGPAEGWRVDERGNVVGATSGRPVAQLDDCIVALLTAKDAATGRGISCSIDPSEAGLRRLQRLLRSGALTATPATAARLEKTLGLQQVSITGVPADSHFGLVMVAADYLMKRLAMGLEPAPISDFPHYLALLAASGRAPRSAMPRWWLTPHYVSVQKDAQGLAWRLQGPGVRCLSEDGYLTASGEVATGIGADAEADQWAKAMTANYSLLCRELPVFAELQTCVDLAVVAALIVKEDLAELAGGRLATLLDPQGIQPGRYRTPRTVASQASLVRQGRSWLVSVSGGVDLNSWAVLDHIDESQALAEVRRQASSSKAAWWWD